MLLSKRMESIGKMVTPGNTVADIGCDHGYLPIWLCETGRIPGAVAMDIHSGPLERARENITLLGLEAYIQLRLSDGMEELAQGEVDSVILAGMGGKLILRILKDCPEVVQELKELILEPQSDVDLVRAYLTEIGFRIEDEEFVLEDGKFYPVIKAVPVEKREASSLPEQLTEVQKKYGPRLLEMRHPVLLQYLQREENNHLQLADILQKAGSVRAAERLKEIQEEIQHIRAAYVYYEV